MLFCASVCARWVGWSIIAFVISPLHRITLRVADVIYFLLHGPFEFHQVHRLVPSHWKNSTEQRMIKCCYSQERKKKITVLVERLVILDYFSNSLNVKRGV